MNHKEGWVLKKWYFPTLVLEKTLDSPLDSRRSNQSILKDINPEYSLEGLKLKLQYFGHLMRVDPLEKTLMLGKIEGKKEKGWQKMRWLDSITNLMDMNLGIPGAYPYAIHSYSSPRTPFPSDLELYSNKEPTESFHTFLFLFIVSLWSHVALAWSQYLTQDFLSPVGLRERGWVLLLSLFSFSFLQKSSMASYVNEPINAKTTFKSHNQCFGQADKIEFYLTRHNHYILHLRQHHLAVKNISSEVSIPGFKYHLCHLFSLWPWSR